MKVDPKQRVPNPPGMATKRVRVINPPGFGSYGRYVYGDELDLPERDWINHIGLYMEVVGDEPWPPKDPEVVKEYKATRKKMTKKSRRVIGRLKETKEKDGDA